MSSFKKQSGIINFFLHSLLCEVIFARLSTNIINKKCKAQGQTSVSLNKKYSYDAEIFFNRPA